MAGEEVRDSLGLLASFPDQITGDILAVDSRDFVISVISGIGFIEEDTPFTIPITDGVPTAINPILPPGFAFEGNFFELDGNNAFFSAYPGGVSVPTGLEKLLDMRMLFEATPQGGGVNQYTVQGRIAGVPVGRGVGIETSGSTLFPVDIDILFDISQGGAAPIDFVITGIGTNADLDVTGLIQKVITYLI